MKLSDEHLGPIAEWYTGRTLLITGGSGLMGKVLVEKLLYSIPGIARIYIIMRSKRGKTPEQRLEDMKKLPMFQRLNAERPEAFSKITILSGDLGLDALGLSEADQKRLFSEVSLVFHCAATLKLEAILKDSIEQNTAGTARIIDLCKNMTKLCSFIYLSTAFCCCDIEELKEKVYPISDKPRDIISVANWINPEALEIATPKIIAPHPNTYTYSKRLAETLVAEQYPALPVSIVRPSIVTPAWEEPVEGWVDNLNGPVGILVGAAKGVIRSMHCKAELHAQVIPVDLAINGLIAIGWKTAIQNPKPKDIPVYNMTQDPARAMTWGEVVDLGRDIGRKYPFEMCLWYPDGNIRSSRFVHNIFAFFFHFLPAYFIDFLMLILFQKRFMVRIYNRVAVGLDLLQFFTTREWIFENSNFMQIWKEMDPNDRKRFPIDFDAIDIPEYIKRIILGARQYCMKESLDSIPRCRMIHTVLWALDRSVTALFYGSILWFIVSYSETARFLLDSVGEKLQDVPLIGSLVAKSY